MILSLANLVESNIVLPWGVTMVMYPFGWHCQKLYFCIATVEIMSANDCFLYFGQTCIFIGQDIIPAIKSTSLTDKLRKATKLKWSCISIW